MSLALVPSGVGRPAVIYLQGCAIRVDVRDAAVKAQERVFTQRLMDAHPDRGGTAAALRRVVQEREAYRVKVAKEYEQIGVPPLVPVAQADTEQMAQARCSCGRWYQPRAQSRPPAVPFCSVACVAYRAYLRRPRRQADLVTA